MQLPIDIAIYIYVAICLYEYVRKYVVSYRTTLTVFLFGVYGFATGLFQALSLYTPEVNKVSINMMQ